MSVHAGAEGEYEKRHNPIWPELEKVLKDHGVSNYSIFLHPATRQLFGYAEIACWVKRARIERCERPRRAFPAPIRQPIPNTISE